MWRSGSRRLPGLAGLTGRCQRRQRRHLTVRQPANLLFGGISELLCALRQRFVVLSKQIRAALDVLRRQLIGADKDTRYQKKQQNCRGNYARDKRRPGPKARLLDRRDGGALRRGRRDCGRLKDRLAAPKAVGGGFLDGERRSRHVGHVTANRLRKMRLASRCRGRDVLRQMAPIDQHRIAADREYIFGRRHIEPRRNRRSDLPVFKNRLQSLQPIAQAADDGPARDVVDLGQFDHLPVERRVPGQLWIVRLRIRRQRRLCKQRRDNGAALVAYPVDDPWISVDRALASGPRSRKTLQTRGPKQFLFTVHRTTAPRPAPPPNQLQRAIRDDRKYLSGRVRSPGLRRRRPAPRALILP